MPAPPYLVDRCEMVSLSQFFVSETRISIGIEFWLGSNGMGNPEEDVVGGSLATCITSKGGDNLVADIAKTKGGATGDASIRQQAKEEGWYSATPRVDHPLCCAWQRGRRLLPVEQRAPQCWDTLGHHARR
ncbi:hypothetical protein Scep_012466 [Stephania cephalantha]|uniref:Uncharacterized protein n=1 Tax=Stephania cephalantha TaxID=152367 RepID=A0AAP0P6Q9_9MAGN